MKIRLTILFLLLISYGDIFAQEISGAADIDLKLLAGKQIEDLEMIQAENPQNLRVYLDEKRQHLQQELKDLKANNPQEFQTAILELKESLAERIEEINNDDPQRLERLMAKRREEERIILEKIKEEDPDRFIEIVNIREKNLTERLESLNTFDHEPMGNIIEDDLDNGLRSINDRPAGVKAIEPQGRKQHLQNLELIPEITDEFSTDLPEPPQHTKHPQPKGPGKSGVPEKRPPIIKPPETDIDIELLELELPDDGPPPIMRPDIDNPLPGRLRPGKGPQQRTDPPKIPMEPPPPRIPGNLR